MGCVAGLGVQFQVGAQDELPREDKDPRRGGGSR
jgi:hypothetical protein